MSQNPYGAQETRINIRVDSELKKEAENIFNKLGINMSDGINIYLRRVVADQGIPFALNLSRSQLIGSEAADLETSFRQSVQAAIVGKQAKGLPVARLDRETNRPYMEYPDGRREYEFDA